jgi:hypothetical protein
MHLAAFETEWETLLARAREVITAFPPHLRTLADRRLPEWAGSTFSRIVAFFPLWVDDVLEEDQPPMDSRLPSRPDEIGTLSLACLLGWWSYLLQDELLDRERARADLLPLSRALHVAAVRLLQGLLPDHQGFWDAFEALSLAMAEAHCWEQRLDLATLTGLESQGLAPEPDQLDNLERLADRSALLHLPVVGALALRGYSMVHPLSSSLSRMVRQYAIARQIGDDRADCLEDLHHGRLNYVSASIMRRLRESNAIQSYAEVDADWLAGQFLYDDELWADIHQVAVGACEAAAQSLAPYKARFLASLVEQQAIQLQRGYEVSLARRLRIRILFSVPPS